MHQIATLTLFLLHLTLSPAIDEVGYTTYHSPSPYHAPIPYQSAPISYAPGLVASKTYAPTNAITSYAPVAKIAPPHQVYETDAPAAYDFEYGVEDPHTGDIKSQRESRRGDVVQGSYSLVEADGTKRVVEYSADAHSGFNAVVHKEPAGQPGGYPGSLGRVPLGYGGAKVAGITYAAQAPPVGGYYH